MSPVPEAGLVDGSLFLPGCFQVLGNVVFSSILCNRKLVVVNKKGALIKENKSKWLKMSLLAVTVRNLEHLRGGRWWGAVTELVFLHNVLGSFLPRLMRTLRAVRMFLCA